MKAKKKPMTKKESNRLYLERKKAKEVARAFEAALEPPAKSQTVDIEPRKSRSDQLDEIKKDLNQAMGASRIADKEYIADMLGENAAKRSPRPNQVAEDIEDGDLYEPYAPKPGEAPLAAGETQETAIQPGDWSSPPKKESVAFSALKEDEEYPEESEGDMALESPTIPIESSDTSFGSLTPEHLSKWLGLAADAIKWLAKRDRRLDSKQKAILQARIDALSSIQSQLK